MPKNDIDILVDFDYDAGVSLFTHADMINDLKDIFNREVDIVPNGCLYPEVREAVDRDKILIYERKAPRPFAS